jgi:APA family basic amino acid/polyamine antiporter
MPVVLAMGAALVPVLFSYGGWQQTNAVAEELVDPVRTLPRALIGGVLVVVATYMLVNVAYLRALGASGLAASHAPAADTMFVYLGDTGRTLITCGIVASTVGFLGMTVLMSARVYQAMAADGLFFKSMATLHPRMRTPVAALVAQCIVALGLLLTGTYGQLLDYVVFADWIFFGLTAASLFVLRARDARDGTRPQLLAPWHPFTTLVFIAAALYVVAGSIVSNPGNAARGAGLIALGLPVYAFWRTRSAGASTPSAAQ